VTTPHVSYVKFNLHEDASDPPSQDSLPYDFHDHTSNSTFLTMLHAIHVKMDKRDHATSHVSHVKFNLLEHASGPPSHDSLSYDFHDHTSNSTFLTTSHAIHVKMD
jgi:hypothetical protein